METSNSDANHVILHAQNDRGGLGHMEASFSAAFHAVLHSQNNRWGLEPIETCTHLVLKSLFSKQETIGEVLNP